MHIATKTLEAINDYMIADQGASFRMWLEKVIPHIGDAYRGDKFPFRSHMGASGIGDECPRKIWYNFRWAKKPSFDGRMLRLFNRGHLEEARFIALLLMIGAQVYQQDENGNQFRISDAGGHFGGSGDGIVYGIPDLPPGAPALCEFKTSGENPFKKLVKEGVRNAKFEHFVQMQVYMRKMGIPIALYMAVNKNTDEIHAELVPLDIEVADQFIERGSKIVFYPTSPDRISNSPGWWACRFCDFLDICHKEGEPEKNCRTCSYGVPEEDGTWKCHNTNRDNIISTDALTKEQQYEGCNLWEKHAGFKN